MPQMMMMMMMPLVSMRIVMMLLLRKTLCDGDDGVRKGETREMHQKISASEDLGI